MADVAQDRRKYPRLPTGQMIGVARVDASGLLAYGRDLSLGGIRFQMVGAEIELGELLRIYLSVEDETVSALGRVAWATEIDPFTTDVGLEFLEIDPEAVALIGRLGLA